MFLKLTKLLLTIFVCMVTFFEITLPAIFTANNPIISILGYSASVGLIYCMALRITKIMEK